MMKHDGGIFFKFHGKRSRERANSILEIILKTYKEIL